MIPAEGKGWAPVYHRPVLDPCLPHLEGRVWWEREFEAQVPLPWEAVGFLSSKGWGDLRGHFSSPSPEQAHEYQKRARYSWQSQVSDHEQTM